MSSEEDISESEISDDDNKITKGDEFFGMILKKKYILIDKIGMGNFSSVWLALNIIDSNLYAIKIQNLDYYEDGKEEALLLLACSKSHIDNIAQLVEYFEVRNPRSNYMNICIVMKLCNGTLKTLQNQFPNKQLPFKLALKVLHNICHGLIVLNKNNYAHTDIKTSNILLSGMDPLFIEFKKYIDETHICIILNEKRKACCNNLGLDKLKKSQHTRAKIYKDNIKKYNALVKQLLKEASNQLIKEFNKICNKQHNQLYYKNKISETSRNFIDINNINFVLSDLGIAHKIKNNEYIFDKTIQPRINRSPEIILGCNWDYSVDMWSIGCLFYEILVGEKILDPEPDVDDLASDSDYCEYTKKSLDIEQLKLIKCITDVDFINYNNGIYYYKYCDVNGDLKDVEYYDKIYLLNKLKSNVLLNDEEIQLAHDILIHLLCDRKNRIEPSKLLNMLNILT